MPYWKSITFFVMSSTFLSASAQTQTLTKTSDWEYMSQPISISAPEASSSPITRTKASGLQPPSIQSLALEADNRFEGDVVPVNTLINEANNGNPAAQNNLGIAYFTGQGVMKDVWLAVGWFQKAAEQGYVAAEYNTGVAYRQIGNIEGSAASEEQARYWFTKAAEAGNSSAQFQLAIMYHSGLGGEIDYNKAVYWYEKASQAGVAAAESNLAEMYLIGQGVPENTQLAFELFQKAANKGNATAQINLASMYATGSGVPKNLIAADVWSRRAMGSPIPKLQRIARQLHDKIESQMTQSEITASQKMVNSPMTNLID